MMCINNESAPKRYPVASGALHLYSYKLRWAKFCSRDPNKTWGCTVFVRAPFCNSACRKWWEHERSEVTLHLSWVLFPLPNCSITTHITKQGKSLGKAGLFFLLYICYIVKKIFKAKSWMFLLKKRMCGSVHTADIRTMF